MTAISRMYDSTKSPIAWVSEWVGPHEGGMTLAMKYAWANALDGASVSKSICGKSLVQHYSPRLHGRSFLVPGWARVARLDEQPTIGALIARRDMSRYVGGMDQWLASDKFFRYCPECIQLGYQSILFQIDALACCPLHQSMLLSECRRCGAPTPRYALTAEAMANPFCCPACGAAYGKNFNPRDWRCAGLHAEASQALLPIVQFLLRAERAQVQWTRWDDWLGPWLGEPEQREKRIATFSILRQIVGKHLDEAVFVPLALPLSVSKSRGYARAVSRHAACATDLHAQRQIYKSIRRYLFKRFPRGVDRRMLKHPQWEEVNLRNDIMRLSLKKCPFVQAVWLWRLRFEEPEAVMSFYSSEARTLSLREEARNWPWLGAGDEIVWAHYVMAGFNAVAELVSEWWGQAAALAASPGADPREVLSIELQREFADRLSPSRVPVPPQIAAVFSAPSSQGMPSSLYVVGPTGGLKKLFACYNAGETRPSQSA